MAATPVFFLPGLLEDAEALGGAVRRLGQLAPCSVADLTGADTIAGLAAQALEQAPAGPLALAGHSMGGYVALEIMRRAPERVERLALLNTHARADSPEATENRARLMALAQADFPEVIRTLMPRLVTAEHLRDAAIIATITASALAVGREAFHRQQRAIIGRPDSRAHLGAIRCKTCVIAARHDQLMPLELLEELARGIPGAELAIIEDSGHMAPLEQPGALARILEAWLRR